MAGSSGNPKSPAWYGGGLAAALPVGCGKIFYVNGGSDGPVVDTNDGLTPATPKRLLQSAIDLCTSGNNDVVIVLNYGGNARAVEAWPVEVNKDMIHIKDPQPLPAGAGRPLPPARMLSQGHASKVDARHNKPGVTALREIAAGQIGIEMLRKVPI